MPGKCWNQFHKPGLPNEMSLVFHPSLTQGYPPELPEELVPCGFCVIHSGGLHLPDGGQSGLGSLQDGESAAHRPIHQNPEPASAAPPVQTHSVHPPVGGGEKKRLGNKGWKHRAESWKKRYLCGRDSSKHI